MPNDGWQTLTLPFVTTTVASFGLACITYRWVEQPAIRWGRPGASGGRRG